MTKNNKGNLFVFEVGPSVKFVSAIKDAIFNKKDLGGVRGGFGKRPDILRFFLLGTLPLCVMNLYQGTKEKFPRTSENNSPRFATDKWIK